MDRHELNRMFDGLEPDPKRERELLRQLLQDGARRKMPMKNWKRIVVGVAAAVLLLGTATAAHYVGVRIVDNREEDGFIRFADGMTYYAVDQLSDDVKAFEAAYTGGSAPMKTFVSWEEMEDFLGVDLMNSPLLNVSYAKNYSHVINNGEQRVEGQFILTVYQGLTQFIAHGCYEVGGCNVDVDAYLFTDKLKGYRDFDEVFYGIRPHDAEMTWESCDTPAGRQVQVVEIDRDGGRRDTCFGALSINGIPIIVRVHSYESLAEAREVLMQVADSFQ